jgi:hypothetical protein
MNSIQIFFQFQVANAKYTTRNGARTTVVAKVNATKIVVVTREEVPVKHAAQKEPLWFQDMQ